MTSGIFISYRRDDTKDAAHYLCSVLKHHFGDGNVFIDVADIQIGDDWQKVLYGTLEASSVVLVLIGQGWLNAARSDGRRRLDDPSDPVRIEIETALLGQIPLIPIRVNGARMPDAADLPSSLQGLLTSQATLLRDELLNHEVFTDDAERIARAISRHIKRRQRRLARPTMEAWLPPRRPGVMEAARRLFTTKELSPRLSRKIAPDRFLRQDPGADIAEYADEVPISPFLPYVEVINWCDELARNDCPQIKVKVLPGSFVLGSWGEGDGDSIRAAAFAAARGEKLKTFNGPVVRIQSYEATSRKLWLQVQRAGYFDQRQSNLVLDYRHRLEGGSVLTLRDLLRHEFGARLPPINDPRMANTLGVAALILVRSGDEFSPYLVSRSRDVAVFNVGGEWHCTASGVAELASNDLDNAQFYRDSVLKELAEEVGLLEHELDILEPVAFCREMTRAGKPQMFFLGVTSIDEGALRRKIQGARRQARAMGQVVETTAMPLLRKPADLSSAEAMQAFHEKGFTIEAAACLHYYFKCQSMVALGRSKGAWWPWPRKGSRNNS